MRQKVLITSALPYSNGSLHFGHIAGAYLPADAYARFERLLGKEVLYICGSDQYGVAITLSAELAGRTPEEQSSFYHQVNTDLFKKLGFSFDHFSKTTCSEHAPTVTEFFWDLKKNGHIEEREAEQLFSEKENRFLADRYVVGTCPRCGYEEARGDECGRCGANYEATDLKNPRSKLTGFTLVSRKTKHYYLLFDHFKERLTNFLKTKGWKSNTMHFASSYIKEIKPRAITRDLSWGVPVPHDKEGKVFYVWFDAPIGYISATQEWAKNKGDRELWKRYWYDPQTRYVQFIGKDNIPFHAIFFPAMIMGQNRPYKLVDELVANEFLNFEGKQFSKSDGCFIELSEFFEHFEPDQIRYTLAANAPETADSEFTWKDFEMRCNVELVGKLGNFVNRVLVFVQNHTSGKVPPRGELQDVDARFMNELSCFEKEIQE
ncbi:MAG: methionine--tRNA ligase, partial [Chlamydiia bacterium]|nr:methionine--tRNA ligase [Chlamydiia bacterium]